MRELYSLTGLQSVKEEVNSIVSTVKINIEYQRRGKSARGFGTLHMIFKGNAGTGKTTVARIIGNIYRELGVLRSGQLVECGRSDLVAGYAGQTAIKTREKVKEALGGVLFIDEAYSLAGDQFGREAIDALVADIENYRSELMVIIAGYSADMDRFLSENQGLASRFPNEVIFEDYTLEEMLSIMHGTIRSYGLCLSESLDPIASELIEQYSGASDFGNARGVRNLCDKLRRVQNTRLANSGMDLESIPSEVLEAITAEDIRALMQNGST